jgi:pimeloyl-[acyl-carrier protein] methyl ester esterase
LRLKHLVLLPGLDGTGELFADFIAALPQPLIASTVAYPNDRFLSYADLHPFIRAGVPQSEPYVLLAESFSTPLAVAYAATNPSNLAALVMCAGFVCNPTANWSRVVKAVARPWLFKLRPPRFVLECLLIGEKAPAALIQKLRRVLRNVRPEVLSGRLLEALDSDARDDLARTILPLMYLEATQDKLLPAYCGDEVLRIRPDTVRERILGPHLLLQREPQKAATAIAAFIEQFDESA